MAVCLSDTIAAQLSALDNRVFEIPIHLKKHVKEREMVINTRIDTEVETLNTSLGDQKKETLPWASCCKPT